MTAEAPYIHLTDGFVQSRLSWEKRVGASWFAEFRSYGALEALALEEHVGQVGVFSTPAGNLECKLQRDNEKLIAIPVDGDPSAEVPLESGLFRARPSKIFEKIATANKLSLESLDRPDVSHLVAVANRSWPSGPLARVVIVLDDDWLRSLAAQALVEQAMRGAQIVVILKFNPQESLPWHIEKNQPQHAPIPSSSSDWKLPLKCFFHPRFGLSEEERIEGCAEKDLIIDAFKKQVFVFRKRLDLNWETPTQRYLEGVARMAASGVLEMPSVEFAREHLSFTAKDEHVILNRVKEARSLVTAALKKKFDGAELKIACALLVPTNPSRKVLATALDPKKVLFFN